jgi:hypothetical protein
MRIIAFVVLAFALAATAAGCGGMSSSGDPTGGIGEPAIAAAYIPLSGNKFAVLEGHGAAVVIRPGVAVTNAHNRDFLPDGAAVIGESADYDLLFFRVESNAAPQMAEPAPGEKIVAYGQGSDGELRQAHGTVRWRVAPVLPRCATCPEQKPFAYEANAGAGFSGGPVVDAETGKLLGITFAYNDEPNRGAEKMMYAYDMNQVNSELSRLLKTTDSAAPRPR